MRAFRTVVFLGVVVSALVSCQLADLTPAGDDPPTPGTGGLSLFLSDGLPGARTLVPPIEMRIASYEVRGAGPLGDAFGPLANTSGSLGVVGLSPGTWTITVDGLNPSGTVIGSGQAEVSITKNATTSATIVIRPLTGVGTLALSVTFPETTIKKKAGSLVGTLTPAGGAPVSLGFTLGENDNNPTWGTHSSSVPAGYYILNVLLTRANGTIWSRTEAVRIIQDQTTTGSWGPV